uniref:RAP domain-containing protein n=1 Tax=Clastoptera arizonana TaxID=38151 RepID=A0A1B6EGB2_9HEMI
MIINRFRFVRNFFFRSPYLFKYEENHSIRSVLYRLCFTRCVKPNIKNVKAVSSVCSKFYSQVSLNSVEKTDGGKKFIEAENTFFHNVLEVNESYQNTIYKHNIKQLLGTDFNIDEEEFNNIINISDWSRLNTDDVVNNFLKVTVYSSENLNLTLSNDMFNELCLALIKVSNNLNDKQLLRCIQALKLWKPCDSVKSKNFLNLWKALDEMCNLCLVKGLWNHDTCLYVMDLWYALYLTRLSKFVYLGQKRLTRRVKSLKKHQLIQMLFYMNASRKVYAGINMFEVETLLQKYIPELSIDEIGIAAAGFFKTKSKMHSVSCMNLIIKRLIDEHNICNDITVTAILKLIRYSCKFELCGDVKLLISLFIPRLESAMLPFALHAVLTLTTCSIPHEDAVDKLVTNFISCSETARLKDMERLAFILVLYNYIPKSSPVLEVILKELDKPHRVEEIDFHKRCIVSLLCYLSLHQVYHERLIAHVLDQNWIIATYGKHPHPISRHLMMLDWNVQLEYPNRNLPSLTKRQRDYVTKKFSFYIPDLDVKKTSIYANHFVDTVKATEKILGGPEYYLLHYPLPHFGKSDIICCLDNNNQPVAIPKEMRNTPYFEDVLKPTSPGKWLCLVIGGRGMYPFNQQTPVGEFATKLRQLKIIGYKPVQIPYFRWLNVPEETFLNFVKEQIFSDS